VPAHGVVVSFVNKVMLLVHNGGKNGIHEEILEPRQFHRGKTVPRSGERKLDLGSRRSIEGADPDLGGPGGPPLTGWPQQPLTAFIVD
jgi:hypothetical protein